MSCPSKPFLAIIFLALTSYPASAGYEGYLREAADRYASSGVTADVLYDILQVENASMNPYAVNHNPDGSFDCGLMQIWSGHVLAKGIEWYRQVCLDPRANILAGAEILAHCFERYGNGPKGIGCYNAASPLKRVGYALKVYRVKLQRLEDRLRTASSNE